MNRRKEITPEIGKGRIKHRQPKFKSTHTHKHIENRHEEYLKKILQQIKGPKEERKRNQISFCTENWSKWRENVIRIYRSQWLTTTNRMFKKDFRCVRSVRSFDISSACIRKIYYSRHRCIRAKISSIAFNFNSACNKCECMKRNWER